MAETCMAVVYYPQEAELKVVAMPVRPPRAGEVLVRVSLSAICGSDLHTIEGRRQPKGPLILGHEICGTIAALGEGVRHDATGKPLATGQRVTWSIAASCGDCFYCRQGIPQKCTALFKYGHESIEVEPALNGGFAEYVCLVPGTTILRIPDELDDATVVFANCSLATMAAAVRMLEVDAGETVLVQGAGLVGLCACALCAAREAKVVLATDVSEERLQQARRFGATDTLKVSDIPDEEFGALARDVAGEHGFDAAIEACGQPAAIAQGLEALRIGGRYLWAGCVFPGAMVELDAYQIITRLIGIQGLHNYAPEDLKTALDFLSGEGRRFPFDTVVAREYPLAEIEQAVEEAKARKDMLRVAVKG